jgi:hypothetical protein
MTLKQRAPFCGVGGESLSGDDEGRFSFLDAQTQGLTEGGSECAPLAAGAPTVNDLQHAHSGPTCSVHFEAEASAGVIDRGLTGLELNRAHASGSVRFLISDFRFPISDWVLGRPG